ncbi:MAG: cytochrome c biogenesis protein CcsA [Flavobacteriaceae bacterium]|nr:MAG: cytochrome c biogenesis protein CcsA [Flavobacteriaceae bacterium]
MSAKRFIGREYHMKKILKEVWAFLCSVKLALFTFIILATTSIIGTVIPQDEQLFFYIHKSLLFGFVWLSAGIITGAVWANSAWGTYWSWDPKETWSLITWFVYDSALHARFTKGWVGTRIAWLSIIGFLSVVFTYYGVNFLLSGLHSYGS